MAECNQLTSLPFKELTAVENGECGCSNRRLDKDKHSLINNETNERVVTRLIGQNARQAV